MPDEVEIVPRYYKPWPHQVEAWLRRNLGLYDYYFKLWCRQGGKDTDDIQYALKRGWDNPGTQSAYVGLDNVWVNNNIFKKYIEGRTHWMDYPEAMIDVKDTQREVYLLNNPSDLAPARIKFIGFKNEAGIIGSAYDNFFITEASLYSRNAFQYIQPIWDKKVAAGEPLLVNFNGTPRGQRNVYYDLLKTYTGCDNDESFPGAHGRCYVDKKTIVDLMMPDGQGGMKRIYSDAYIEQLKDRYMRQFGNLKLFYQEFYCDFTTVNAGLIYQGIEVLLKEDRFTTFNLDTSRPVYVAWDLASKTDSGSKTVIKDATAAVIFQYYNGKMFIYDYYESMGKSTAECVADLALKPYFHLIRMGFLPWDAGVDKTTKGLREELEETFPAIQWHILGQTSVMSGVEKGWKIFPNLLIHSENCDRLMDCFMNYEYRYVESTGAWAPPRRSQWNHGMDAFRYGCVSINEYDYLGLKSHFDKQESSYTSMWDDGSDLRPAIPATWKKPEKQKENTLDYY